MSNSSNWCPEIYRGLFVNRHNDDFIYVSPCCQSEGRLESTETFNFKTSPWLQGLRQKFDRGEYPSACDNCWNVEKVGHKSRRQSANEFYNLPDESRDIVLQGLDYSSTWACNLACVMCTPKSSSTWANELNLSRTDIKNLGRLFQKKNTFLDRLNVEHLRKLHLNGGEPLLNDDQCKFLQHLDEQGVLKDLFISYNTNGTVMPSDAVIDFWGRSSLVKLFFSIDATGGAFEYIRYPGNWAETEKNILEMKRRLPSNVMFGFNVTVGPYNVLELKSVWDWFKENISTNRAGDPSDFCWQLAHRFDIAQLNDAARDEFYKDVDQIDELHGVVEHIKSCPSSDKSDKWIGQLEEIDSRRGTNWREKLKIARFY